MGNSTEVVICGFARTPIGKYRGALRNYSAIELGIMTVKELLSRTKINLIYNNIRKKSLIA